MIDQFFSRSYDPNKYNCAHFVAEVFEHETGRDISKMLGGFLQPPRGRFVRTTIKDDFQRLQKPEDNAIVLMSRPRTSPHVGLFLRGKVLHLTEHSGVQFMPLHIAALGFSKVRFYKC